MTHHFIFLFFYYLIGPSFGTHPELGMIYGESICFHNTIRILGIVSEIAGRGSFEMNDQS